MLSRIQSSLIKPLPLPLLVIALMALQCSYSNKNGNSGSQSTAATPANSTDQDKDDPKGLRKAAREVVDKLAAEDYEGIRKNFNEKTKRAVSAQKLRDDWTSFIRKYGPYKNAGKPDLGHANGYDVLVVPCRLERGGLNVEVDYDSGGKIGGLWIRPVS